MTSYPRASTNAAPAFIVALRQARVEAGLSQQALAGDLGWEVSRLREYEYGHRPARPKFLEAWAGALGLRITVAAPIRVSTETAALLRDSVIVCLQKADGIGCSIQHTPDYYRQRAADLQQLLDAVAIEEAPGP
jgi:transcriptional regulator with XRE-family HTH domain